MPSETLVKTQERYLEQPDLNRMYHFWEALTPSELEERMAFLSKEGMDLLHLCQGWGIWEKLDGGGCINPHGAEQAALYYRTASKYGMHVIQALSYYPYAEKISKEGWYGTRPEEKYFEAGFMDSNWENKTRSMFNSLFSRYLQDFGLLFMEETALCMMSSSGEGDPKAGSARCSWIRDETARHCPQTLFYAEPIHVYWQTPSKHAKGWNFERLG
jgi:hypothetical protein